MLEVLRISFFLFFCYFIYSNYYGSNESANCTLTATVLGLRRLYTNTNSEASNQRDGGSRANMIVQIVLGVVYFSMLVVQSSSNEVMEFRWVKSDDDKVLCGTSTPNKTLSAVGLRVQCVAACSQGCRSPCHAINYRQNAKLCELFYYEPCSYDQQPDCAIYKVVDNTRLMIFKYY